MIYKLPKTPKVTLEALMKATRPLSIKAHADLNNTPIAKKTFLDKNNKKKSP